MRRLPSLAAGRSVWRLPLTHDLQRALPVCLLLHSGCRRNALADWLRRDVPLALWTLGRAYQQEGRTLERMNELAEWLDNHALRELTWSEAEWQTADSPAALPIALQAELNRHAICVAGIAAEAAGPGDLQERAYLLGLVHRAADWLNACREPAELSEPGKTPERLAGAADTTDSREVLDCLPPAFADRLTRLSGTAGLSPVTLRPSDEDRDVETLVREAIRLAAARRETEPPAAAAAAPGGAQSRAAQSGRTDESVLGGESCFGLPGLLARLDHLLQLERQFDTVLEQHKLAAIKELAYGASHEINNPLANISTRAQTLLRDERDPERRRKLATINSQAFRAHEMISDLMLFAHPPDPVLVPVDLVRLASDVVDGLREEAARQHTEVEFLAPTAPVGLVADPTLLAAAVQAVCRNALEALASGGKLEVSVAGGSGDPDLPQPAEPCGEEIRWAQVEIRDNGPGLSEEVRRHAFEPYYCGREAGRGLGLGLSKCWRIVTLHEGRMEVESEPGHGSTFRLVLPGERTPGEAGATENSQPDDPDEAGLRRGA